MPTYPLPPSHLGAEHVALLEHIVPSVALATPGLTHGPVTVEVALEPDNLTGGWRVRGPFGYLGWLDAAETAEFPDLQRIRHAHLHAATWASIELADAALDLAVHLGLAPWQVPRNDLPAGAVLLAPGRAAPLDAAVSTDVSPAQLKELGAAQFFVTLQAVPATGAVVATLEDHVLGTLDAPSFVRDLLAAAEGTTVCARAYAAEGRVAVDLPEDPAAAFDAPVPALGGTPVLPPAPRADDVVEHYFPAAEVTDSVPRGGRAFAPVIPSEPALAPAPAEEPAEPDTAPSAAEKLADTTADATGRPEEIAPTPDEPEPDPAAPTRLAEQHIVWAPWPDAMPESFPAQLAAERGGGHRRT